MIAARPDYLHIARRMVSSKERQHPILKDKLDSISVDAIQAALERLPTLAQIVVISRCVAHPPSPYDVSINIGCRKKEVEKLERDSFRALRRFAIDDLKSALGMINHVSHE